MLWARLGIPQQGSMSTCSSNFCSSNFLSSWIGSYRGGSRHEHSGLLSTRLDHRRLLRARLDRGLLHRRLHHARLHHTWLHHAWLHHAWLYHTGLHHSGLHHSRLSTWLRNRLCAGLHHARLHYWLHLNRHRCLTWLNVVEASSQRLLTHIHHLGRLLSFLLLLFLFFLLIAVLLLLFPAVVEDLDLDECEHASEDEGDSETSKDVVPDRLVATVKVIICVTEASSILSIHRFTGSFDEVAG